MKIVEALIKNNDLDLRDYGSSDPENDVLFLRECVTGVDPAKRIAMPLRKSFLYDIVNNVFSGMDVDKLDYIERDSRNTNVKLGCEVNRLVLECRVMRSVQGQKNSQKQLRPHLVWPERALTDVFGAFRTRFDLHNKVYQHKVVKAIEYMLVDAMVLADAAGVFDFTRDGERRKHSLANSVDDVELFLQTNDHAVFEAMKRSRLACAQSSRDLVSRILTRNLYKSVGEVPIVRTSDNDDDPFAKLFDAGERRIVDELLQTPCALAANLRPQDVYVERMRAHYGKMDQNPLNDVLFFKKNVARIVEEEKYVHTLPRYFLKESIRIFCKTPRLLKTVDHAFRQLVRHYRSTTPFLAQSSWDSPRSSTNSSILEPPASSFTALVREEEKKQE